MAGELFVELIDGFALTFNDRFLIADVAGQVTGQFTGLDDGDLVGNFAGMDLFITYAGGDGNDVALFTAIPEPQCGIVCGLFLLVGLLGGRFVRRNGVM